MVARVLAALSTRRLSRARTFPPLRTIRGFAQLFYRLRAPFIADLNDPVLYVAESGSRVIENA